MDQSVQTHSREAPIPGPEDGDGDWRHFTLFSQNEVCAARGALSACVKLTFFSKKM